LPSGAEIDRMTLGIGVAIAAAFAAAAFDGADDAGVAM